jgi:UDP-N-acetylglucosamine transferase subunit ALG13
MQETTLMAHRLEASFQSLLSDDPQEMAQALAEIAKAWTVFTDAVKEYHGELKFSIADVKTATPIYKRGRKRSISEVKPLGSGHEMDVA